MVVQKPVVILGVFVADTAYRARALRAWARPSSGRISSSGRAARAPTRRSQQGRLGADVTFVTRLGRDPFADMARETWKDAGVKSAVIETPESYTGAAYIFVEETTGNNAIIVCPGAASLISRADIDENAALIGSAGVFVTQLEQPIEAAMRGLEIAKVAGVTTILNPAPAAKLPDRIYASATTSPRTRPRPRN